MLGQNSFSKQDNTNQDGGAIVSSNNAGSAAPAAPAASTGAKKPLNKTLLFAIIGVVVVAAGVGAYFLFFNKNGGSSSSTVKITEGVSASGPNASQEVQKQLDQKISSSSDEREVLDAKFSKISFMVMDDEFDSALTALNEFNPSDLSDYDQYRLYNYYTTVYQNLGNESEVERYQKLADEAHKRDLSSYSPNN